MIKASEAAKMADTQPNASTLEINAENEITKAALAGNTTVIMYFGSVRDKSYVSKFLLSHGYRIDSFADYAGGHQGSAMYSIKVIW